MSNQQTVELSTEEQTGAATWATFERSIMIDVPVSSIGDVLGDPVRYPLLFPGTQSVKTDGVFPEVGGRVNLTYRAAGMSFQVDLTVVENDPHHRVIKTQIRDVQCFTNAVLEGQNSWLWEPEGHSTRLTVRYEHEVPRSTYAKQLECDVIRRLNAANVERSLNNIKQLLEANRMYVRSM